MITLKKTTQISSRKRKRLNLNFKKVISDEELNNLYDIKVEDYKIHIGSKKTINAEVLS